MGIIILYVIVFLLACGLITGLTAHFKGENIFEWGLTGIFLPIIGILLLITGHKPPHKRKKGTDGRHAKKKVRKRPKRCCGSYIPDCEGCPFFQKSLFADNTVQTGKKGDCLFYHRELKDDHHQKRSRVIMEEDEEKQHDAH